MLVPENKESESIDKINSEIESLNNQEINYVSKDNNFLDENIYYINNKRKNKKEENKKYPEPNDIDIDFSVTENNYNNNNKKYPEPKDIDDVLSLNTENKNIISDSNYKNNRKENEIISSSSNYNIKFTNTNNNVNDNKNITDEIDDFNDNIRDFEKRNNIK